MLKHRDRWQRLTAEEKLFLLAMAFELPSVSGLEVSSIDITDNAGFDYEKLCEIAWILERKKLIRVEVQPLMFKFRGDAITSSLCGAKLAQFEREEYQTSKYSYTYRMELPGTVRQVSSRFQEGSIFQNPPQF